MPDLFSLETIGIVIIAGILILLGVTLFLKPIRLLLRLLVNTIAGFFALFVLNYIGGLFGVTLGINLFNAVIVGIFGLPGVGLLLLLQWLLII